MEENSRETSTEKFIDHSIENDETADKVSAKKTDEEAVTMELTIDDGEEECDFEEIEPEAVESEKDGAAEEDYDTDLEAEG